MVTIETIENIPSEADWIRMVQTATPAGAIKLWQLAEECLVATNNQDQQGWGQRVGISKRVLRERGIPF
jgi:hypothetical protein